MKQKLFNIFTFVTLCILFGYTFFYSKDEEETPVDQSYEIRLEQPEFLLASSPEGYLKDALNYYNITHPEIVYAQAVLETGNFKSRICKEYNNLFGLYNSRTGDYYKFEHWSESVIAYLDYIQIKYHPPGDYYLFLKRIGYAEDPDYIIKVKKIVKKNNNDKRADSIKST